MSITQDIAPIFTREERAAACTDFSSLLDRKAALFLTRMRFDARFAPDLELAAAATLFTNLLLMQRSPRGVMKVADIHVNNDALPPHAIANAVRGMLTGEFSTLSNFDHWIRILSEQGSLPAHLVEMAERSIQFLESYAARQQLAMDEPADFLLAITSTMTDESYATFTTDEPFYGALDISCGDRSTRFLWSEFVNRDSVSIRHLQHESHMILDLDFTKRSNVIQEWLEALSDIDYFSAHK